MPLTTYDAQLEAWADEAVAMEQNMEALYGPPATPPTLPPLTTYDGLLEAIVDACVGVKDKLLDQSPIYHNKDSAYVKTVPAHTSQAELQKIGGKTVVWNQLGNFGTITGTGSATSLPFTAGTQIVANHKYYFSGKFTMASQTNCAYIYARSGGANVNIQGLGLSTSKIFTASYGGTSDGTTSATDGNLWLYVSSTLASGDSVTDLQLTDLTLLYGAGNEPTTVAEHEAIFPSVYSYNAGTLLSAGVTEVVSQSRNILDASQVVQGNWTVPTNTSNVHTDNYIAVLPNTTYYLKTISANGIYVQYYNIDKAVSGGVTKYDVSGFSFVTNADTQYVRIMWYQVGGITPADIVNGSVCLSISSSADGTYTPYKAPIQYPIPAEIRNIEGYGWSAGTAYNYIDYERKKFVQNVARVDLGSLIWSNNDSSSPKSYVSDPLTLAKAPANSITMPNIITTKYNVVQHSKYRTSGNITIIYASSSYAKRILICDDVVADRTALKTSLDGVYLYYELATPVEVDISAYLTDDNLIEVEAGGTLTFENQNGDDYRIPVPSEVLYDIDVS